MENKKAKLHSISKNYENGKLQLTFEFDEFVSPDKIGNELLSIIIKKYRKKRSIDANAYYWRLINKLSNKLDISINRMHNIILSRYGQLESIDGKLVYLVIPDSEEGENKDRK